MRKALDVRIDKVVAGGMGMGRFDGKVVFVDYCAVGDRVKVRVIKEKKSYIFGEIVDLVEMSPSRIEPACGYFTECGGCSFWHVNYETELTYKKALFIETFRKIGGIDPADVEIFASSPNAHYRNRIQFKAKAVDGKVVLGFYKRGTNYIIDIGRCLIADERINGQIPAVRSFLSNLPFKDNIPQVDLTVDDEGNMVIMIVHVLSDDISALKDKVKETFGRHFAPDIKPFIQTGRKSTIEPIYDDDAHAATSYTLKGIGSDLSYPVQISPGSFLQVNYRQNLRLIDLALRFLDLTKDDTVLDLYCGAGNFTFAAAYYCKDVTGVESYEPSIADAVRNANRLDLRNVKFICADVVSEAQRMAEAGISIDCLIIDPPRQGAIEALKDAVKVIGKKIVYISCDMATFSRDAAFLKGAGFDLEDIALVDMFPRTYHVEIVAVFNKSQIHLLRRWIV